MRDPLDMPDPTDMPGPGDPRWAGYRVESIWAYLVIDPRTDEEGFLPSNALVAWALAHARPCPILPPGVLLCSDQRRVDQLQDLVEAMAEDTGLRVRVCRFDMGAEISVVGGDDA